MVRAGQRLYARGLAAGLHGCISARLNDGLMMISPRGTSLANISPDTLCILDQSGKWLAGGQAPEETKTHFEIYKARPDISVCLRAWPPMAVAFCLKHADPAALYKIMPDLPPITTAKPTALSDEKLLFSPPNGIYSLSVSVMDALYALESLELVAGVLCAHSML